MQLGHTYPELNVRSMDLTVTGHIEGIKICIQQ